MSGGASAVREGAGLFRLEGRLLIEVTGSDRTRWLQGQISNDVEVLGPDEGCYATVLTVKGRIVSDLRVLSRGDRFWLESGAAVQEALLERLDRYIVADDVELEVASDRFARLAIEGRNAAKILAAVGVAAPDPWNAIETTIAGCPAVVWAFGFSNLPAYQVFVAPEDEAPVRAEVLSAGAPLGLVEESAETLETLRIESGVPGLGSELDEEVFPAEARLAHAISTTKGCYTGQEIVERIRSRGAVNFLLVGLRFEGAAPEPGTALTGPDDKRLGEVTSVAVSAEAGAIGLGFLRREHEAPGTEVRVGDRVARVSALPFLDAPPPDAPPA